MKFAFTALSAIALAATVFAQDFTIATPANVVVCQPLLIQWTGGTSPYFLIPYSILPGGQPNAPALHDFGQVDGNSLLWTVNIEPNTSIGLTVRDSQGQIRQSAPITINPGSDTSCVGKDPSTSTGPTTAGNTSSGAPSTTPTTSGSGATTPTTPATTPSTPASTPTTPATNTSSRPATSNAANTTTRPTSTNAAPAQTAGFKAAAAIGVAAIALLA